MKLFTDDVEDLSPAPFTCWIEARDAFAAARVGPVPQQASLPADAPREAILSNKFTFRMLDSTAATFPTTNKCSVTRPIKHRATLCSDTYDY